jgi:hypothetical protein
MMPASTKGGGQCVCNAPDVCKTPSPGGPVPIPYPNIGQVNQASKTATKTKFVGKPVVLKNSEIPRSSGDEAGTAGGGVVSNVNMDKVTYKKGSSKLKVEGQQCEYHTAMTGHNGSNANTVGAQVAPSQTKVLIGM